MRALILDRDGVINEDSDAYIKSAGEWVPIPGSLEAIARLSTAGWRILVATNQSGLGRGLFDMAALNAIHTKMIGELARKGGQIEAIFFCPHAPLDDCDCRKPRTGLFRDIARRFDIQLNGVPCIGDSLRDIQAAIAVGARPLLVRTGEGERTVGQIAELRSIEVFADLAAAADSLLAAG
jgi:D-glycero-D-manno-heptose 1,7-bisphosphate phosphatase